MEPLDYNVLARIADDGETVICGNCDYHSRECRAEFGRIVALDVIEAGYRRFWFGRGWYRDDDGLIHLSTRAIKHLQRGEQPRTRRGQIGTALDFDIDAAGVLGGEPLHHVVLCWKCGKRNLLDAEHLR